ncbi:hypothetical protein [Nonomuraea typhae]|uniref:hypothetical protein n=1 Tax=Nonomuraea typhae TaxID=2603600 RepID=UPI0012FB0839|nr:hypothetical protein [Nonomuraea typhae]
MEKWVRREVPRQVLEQASAQPGGYVYAIDHRQIRDASGNVPPEAIVGCWKAGDDGRPTGEHAANPGHGPIADDFRALSEADHWLGWAGEDPAAEVRRSVEETLREAGAWIGRSHAP